MNVIILIYKSLRFKRLRYEKLLPERSDLNVYHGEAIIHRHIENMYHDFSIVIKLMQPVP